MKFGNNVPPQPMGSQPSNAGVISLKKGQRIDLSKSAPSLVEAMVGLGWDANDRVGQDFDLDASAFLLGINDRARGIEDFIFYNNLTGINGCCVHQGDNLTGDGDGDDEQILINFNKVPAEINKIAITVTIHEAVARRQNFGQVRNAYVRIVDNVTHQELIRFDLGEDFSTETAIVVAELYKLDGTWRMSAVGSGYAGGLAALATSYGLTVG